MPVRHYLLSLTEPLPDGIVEEDAICQSQLSLQLCVTVLSVVCLV